MSDKSCWTLFLNSLWQLFVTRMLRDVDQVPNGQPGSQRTITEQHSLPESRMDGDYPSRARRERREAPMTRYRELSLDDGFAWMRLIASGF